jgi:hypothetical protein
LLGEFASTFPLRLLILFTGDDTSFLATFGVADSSDTVSLDEGDAGTALRLLIRFAGGEAGSSIDCIIAFCRDLLGDFFEVIPLGLLTFFTTGDTVFFSGDL